MKRLLTPTLVLSLTFVLQTFIVADTNAQTIVTREGDPENVPYFRPGDLEFDLSGLRSVRGNYLWIRDANDEHAGRTEAAQRMIVDEVAMGKEAGVYIIWDAFGKNSSAPDTFVVSKKTMGMKMRTMASTRGYFTSEHFDGESYRKTVGIHGGDFHSKTWDTKTSTFALGTIAYILAFIGDPGADVFDLESIRYDGFSSKGYWGNLRYHYRGETTYTDLSGKTWDVRQYDYYFEDESWSYFVTDEAPYWIALVGKTPSGVEMNILEEFSFLPLPGSDKIDSYLQK